MGKNYIITQEQLEDISHYKRMFEANADSIKLLCNSEKDDIVYGYELGKMHSHLSECYLGMMQLESEIKEQKMDFAEGNETTI